MSGSRPAQRSCSREVIDVEVSRTTTHDFDLIPARTRGKLDGQYTLTLQANCEAESRPVLESARTRTYNATLAHDGLALTLKLSGTNILLTNGQDDTFEGSVDPNNKVVFNFGTFFYNYLFYRYGNHRNVSGLLSCLCRAAGFSLTVCSTQRGLRPGRHCPIRQAPAF